MFSFISTFLYDILREKHSRKYSTTKSVALAATFHLFVGFIVGLVIMYKKQEVDHILIGEMSTLVLVLLGFKNFGKSGATSAIVGEDTELSDNKKRTVVDDIPASDKTGKEEGVF